MAARRAKAVLVAFEDGRRPHRPAPLAALAACLVVVTAIALTMAPDYRDSASNPAASTTPSTTPPTGQTTGTRPTTTAQPPPSGTAPAATLMTPPNSTQSVTPSSTRPTVWTLAAVGGMLIISCEGFTASIQSIQPATGFTATHQTRTATKQIQVVFASPTHQSDVKARCGPLGLDPTIKESDQ